MDYSEEYSGEQNAGVVPTLLANREQMERAVRDLEIRFLEIATPTFILHCYRSA